MKDKQLENSRNGSEDESSDDADVKIRKKFHEEEVRIDPFAPASVDVESPDPLLPTNGTSSPSHKSFGAKHFYKNCEKGVLSEPLSATFHLCRVETNKSTRKLSLRTRSAASLSPCDSASSSPVNYQCDLSASFSDNDNIFNVDEEPTLKFDLLPRKIPVSAPLFERESSVPEMGCGCSSVSPQPEATKAGNSSYEEDEDSDEKHQAERRDNDDVNMTSMSNADLLHAQRQYTGEVTRGLEDRWIRSHFSDQQAVAKRQDTRSKRRKIGCRVSDTSNPDVSAKIPGVIDDLATKQKEPSTKGDNGIFDTAEFKDVKHHLCVLHFNDVYEISERKKDPVGGASRFSSLIRSQVKEAIEKTGERPLVVFCGDCLNPSTLSCATQGRHMIDVLNNLEVDVAVFGNHEFDFGVEHAAKCVKQMKSTWLLGNVIDKLTKRNLADGVSKKLIKRKNGLKIGLVGLVEEEWLDTLATVDKADLDYQDYVKRGRELARELREEGADFVIALTHMRWPNDIRLAREVPDIDLILGGHDHEYGVKDIDECLIIKSGSDFRNFSSVDIYLRNDGCVDVKLMRHDVTRKVPVDDEMWKIVNRYMTKLEESLEAKIGTVNTPLNGEFRMIRSQETTLGNFVADIMATVTKADLVLINSGTFRSDAVHSSGNFRLHDLMTILPINDTVVTIEVTGQQLLDALENGVSKVPKLEGRFPQVSGVCFGFNREADPGKRVIRETVRVNGRALELNRTYLMATKAYVARGRDGYTCLSKCRIRTDPDSGPLLSTVVRNHIMNVARLMDFEKKHSCKVSVSCDGRSISCDKMGLDANQAFAEGYTEAPIDTIQKSMRPVIDRNNNMNNNESELHSCPKENAPKTLHVPNFIASAALPETAAEVSDEIGRKVASLRKEAVSGERDSVKLLQERSETPHDVRWQITPVLEARIFNCRSLDG